MRYALATPSGEEVPGTDAATAAEAIRNFTRDWAYARDMGYHVIPVEADSDEDEYDEAPAPVAARTANRSTVNREPIKRRILDVLNEGPEIPFNIAAELGMKERVVRTHLWQLKVASMVRPTGRTVSYEATRGERHQQLWEEI